MMKKKYNLNKFLPTLLLVFLTSIGFSQEAVNTAFGPEAGVFTVELDVVPSHAPMNGGIGLSDTEVGTWGDMSCIVGFHPTGQIRVFDSNIGGYQFENEILFAAGTSYHVVLEVDVPNQSYSVTVTPDGGAATVVADNYGFRGALAAELNNYASYNDTNVAFGGVPGATLDITNYVATPGPELVTTYTEDFEAPVSLDLWAPNGITHDDGSPGFVVEQMDGQLNTTVDQVNFFDGQFYNFTEHENIIIDMTDNTFITFDVRVAEGATYDGADVDEVAFLVSPWGPKDDGSLGREFAALAKNVPDDGEWYTMVYDISEQIGVLEFDGSVLENNFSEIQAVLIENVIFPGVYAFSMEFDNFHIGAAAAPPAVVTSYTEDFETPVSLDLWAPNGITHDDGSPGFVVEQMDGQLNTTVDQVNFFDGQFYNLTEHENIIVDMTNSTFISFDVRVAEGATYDGADVDEVAFLVSPWGPKDDGTLGREFAALAKNVPDDGEWYTMVYDISEQIGVLEFDGSVLENNFSEIQAVLIENVVFPGVYAFSMEFDNFKIGDAAAPPTIVTSYLEDFNAPVSLDLWAPNGTTHDDGSPAFDVVQDNDQLNTTVDQVNFFDGQFYNLTEHENIIVDMTNSTFISFDVRVAEGATYDGADVDEVAFLVSPWGPKDDGTLGREFAALAKNVPDDGEWYTMVYDISEQIGVLEFDGSVLENNFSEIQAVLIENVVFPGVYAFSMEFDNFKIGDAAAPPTVVTSYLEDFNAPVSLDLWAPNGTTHDDGSPAFDVVQDNDQLNTTVDQVNFFDGQFYNLTEHENIIVDMTNSTFISFDVRVAEGATYDGADVDSVAFLVSPWGPKDDGSLGREFAALAKNVPDDGEWYTMVYDISEQIGVLEFDGSTLENNFSEIEAVLIENVVFPGVYAFSMEFDNFKIGDAAAPPTVVTSYLEDFNAPVSLDLWAPNGTTHGDGSPAFDVVQDNDQLNTTVNQVNFFDGQFYNLTEHENIIVDMTNSTFISFDVRVAEGATYDGADVDSVAFLVSPWGPKDDGSLGREFAALAKNVPDDGEWYTMVYDISEQIGVLEFDGSVLENNFSEIEAVLIENVVFPGVYAFSMEFDNFKIGDIAAPPTLVTSYTEDFTDPVSLDLWAPNGITHDDGTAGFDVVQADGQLNTTVDQVNFFDGQFYNLTEHENIIVDMTDNTFISFDVKVAPGATYDDVEVDSVAFLVSPWGPKDDGTLGREFAALRINVPADGLWHTIDYDISLQIGVLEFDGSVLENNFTEIEAVLIENVVFPGTYAFSMEFDDFKIGVTPPTVVTTYLEDFNAPVSLDLWAPNGTTHDDGTPAFDVEQAMDQLNTTVDQVNFFDGQFYNLTQHENIIVDMSLNPYITFDVNVAEGATYDDADVDSVAFLVSPWGPKEDRSLGREFAALRINVPSDGEWHTVFYDISLQIGILEFDGSVLENNFSEIEAVLIENVVFPGTYAFGMQFDNFRIGEAAVATKEPRVPLFTTAFPNPVSDKLFLQAEEAIELVSVYDIHGRLLSTQKVDKLLTVSIDFSTYTTGVYIVETRSANKISSSKVLKN